MSQLATRPKSMNLDEQGRNNEERSNIIGNLFYLYVYPLLFLGWKDHLNFDNVWPVAKQDQEITIHNSLAPLWEQEKRNNPDNPKLWKAFLRLQRWPIFKAFLFQGVSAAIQLYNPIVVGELLDWFIDEEATTSDGWNIIILLFSLPFIGCLADAQANLLATRNYMQLRAATASMVFRKSLRIPVLSQVELNDMDKGKSTSPAKENQDKDKTSDPSKKQALTMGQILNLQSSDGEYIGRMSMSFVNGLIVPAQIGFILWRLYVSFGGREAGEASATAFLGIAVIIVVMPALGLILKKTFVAKKKQLAFSDKRMRATTDALMGIRVLKFYGWEKPMMERIKGHRLGELEAIWESNFLTGCLSMVIIVVPIITPLVSFVAYYELGGEFTPIVLFPAILYYSQLTFPLFRLPQALSDTVVGFVSCARVQSFLMRPELESVQSPEILADHDSVKIVSASFGFWGLKDAKQDQHTSEETDSKSIELVDKGPETSKQTGPVLHDINFTAKRGQLTAVIGKVASGKSALLMSILGETQSVLNSDGNLGQIATKGRLAYVSQSAWIQQLSVRDNILFGADLDEKRYEHVLDACALRADLDVLPNRDLCQIGDRGINLSGGQKARVALARAMYLEADVYLLDDPLSAVDVAVGQHIFEHVIKALVEQGKTVVLVTNHLHFLPECDSICRLQEGRLAQQGTLEELKQDAEFLNMFDAHLADLREEGKEEAKASVDLITLAVEPANKADSEGGTDPKSEQGPAIVVPIASAPLQQEKGTGQAVTANRGNQQIETEEVARGGVSLSVYAAHFQAMGNPCVVFFFVLMLTASGSIATFSQYYWLGYWSDDVYDEPFSFYVRVDLILLAVCILCLLLRNYLNATVSTTACERHHAKLLYSVLRGSSTFYDATPIGRILNRFSRDISAVDGTLPRFLFFALVIISGVLINFTSVIFVQTRFVWILLTIVLLFTLLQRIYKPTALQLQRLESVSRSPIYEHFTETLAGLTTIRSFNSTERFLQETSMRISKNSHFLILVRMVFQWATVYVGLLNAVVVFSVGAFVIDGKTNDMTLTDAGSIVTVILGTGSFIGYIIVLVTELENQMNSVERIDFYKREIPAEADWEHSSIPVPPDWPVKPSITFEGVTMHYREGLEPALKDLNVAFAAGQKIGIVGRTGSGKSTTMLTILRMYELQAGRILIDGLDISQIGLHVLRKSIAIIPQDPVVFNGSVLSNLDPFSEHSEEQCWTVLAQVELRTAVQEMGGLEAICAEGGSNFSQGQRQLLCMARALLRKPRLFLMDEATSSVDVETDKLLQTLVKEQLGDATVITIAHRLNTVIDYDQIVVMSQGTMIETGPPQELIELPGGHFAKMYTEMRASAESH